MKIDALQFTRWTGLSILFLSLSAAGAYATVPGSMLTAQDSVQAPSDTSAVPLRKATPETEAELLALHHKYMDAIRSYRAIRPETAEIYNQIGVAYEHMFMDEDARANFEHAIRIDRKFGPAYNNLGTIYYHEKDYKRAERFYKMSLRHDAKNASVYGNLGTLYVARGKFQDGLEAYQHAFLLDPKVFEKIAGNGIVESASVEDLANMNFLFAKIYAQAGMNDLAVAYLEKALNDGFRDKKLDQDQEFAGLHGMPEFQRLIDKQQR